MRTVLIVMILAITVSADKIDPMPKAVIENFGSDSSRADWDNNCTCDMKDFAIAADPNGYQKAVRWGRWQGTDPNDHFDDMVICLYNLSIIAQQTGDPNLLEYARQFAAEWILK